MTHTQTFIELAIEGGYEFPENSDEPCSECGGLMILDPLAWQAVGKVKGWKVLVCREDGSEITKHKRCKLNDHYEWDHDQTSEWHYQWECFIWYLADGKTIEGALGEILK